MACNNTFVVCPDHGTALVAFSKLAFSFFGRTHRYYSGLYALAIAVAERPGDIQAPSHTTGTKRHKIIKFTVLIDLIDSMGFTDFSTYSLTITTIQSLLQAMSTCFLINSKYLNSFHGTAKRFVSP